MTPTLKKLSVAGISATRIAGLVEKHVGNYTNSIYCNQALEALMRVRDPNLSTSIAVLKRLLGDEFPTCDTVKRIVQMLRAQ